MISGEVSGITGSQIPAPVGEERRGFESLQTLCGSLFPFVVESHVSPTSTFLHSAQL